MAHGSLNNLLYSRSASPEPEVGMGATEICWTDRHPYTIISVESPTRIILRRDNYEITNVDDVRAGKAEPRYRYLPNPDSSGDFEVTKRKNGRWVRRGEPMSGTPFLLGFREEYYDRSF